MPKKVKKIVSSDTSIKVGEEFTLRATLKPYNADEDYLTWKIVGNKGIVQFEDGDLDDDEVELKALKAGTTKIRCSIYGRAKKYSKTITITVKKATGTIDIKRVGRKNRSIRKGHEFDLEVNAPDSIRDSQLKWTIKKKSILAFEDNDRYGDDVELIALKKGTSVVRCKNLKTGKIVKYKITVR